MRDLTALQILAGVLLSALAGAVAQDLVFGRLDRIRRRQAEARAARLQKRIDRLEAGRTVRRRPVRCEEVPA